MKVLFDHNVPRGLRRLLPGHVVQTAFECGWSALSNGELIAAAEDADFAVLVTADQGIFYQHNNARRRIALVVLSTNRRPVLLARSGMVWDAISRCSPGTYELIRVADESERS